MKSAKPRHNGSALVARFGPRVCPICGQRFNPAGPQSLELSLRWMDSGRLPADWPWYLAVQDGMRMSDVAAVLDRFAGIFLGGTTRYKATAWYWARLAHSRGKRFHYARAGTPKKVVLARFVGADSIDSTFPLWTENRFVAFVRTVSKPLPRVLWGPEIWSVHPDQFAEEGLNGQAS